MTPGDLFTHIRYPGKEIAEPYQAQEYLLHDGRAIVGGTSDVAEARSAYARYIGL